MMDTRTASMVLIDWASGDQTRLERTDKVVGKSDAGGVRPIEIEEVADVLADPDGWVQWESRANVPTDDEWDEGEPTFDTPCVSRVYARNVVHVMLVWDD